MSRQLERAIREMQQEVQEIHRDLNTQMQQLQEEVNALDERLTVIEEHEDLEQTFYQEIKSNRNAIQQLDMKLDSKVGKSSFQATQEQIKQLQAQLGYLNNILD